VSFDPYSHSSLGEFAEGAPNLLWRSGPGNRREWFNKAWLTFTGHTMEAELQSDGTACVHPDDLIRCALAYETALDHHSSTELEYRLLRHDGVYRLLHESSWPFWDGDGFAGFFGSCTDVTEHREADRRLDALTSDRDALAHEVRHRVNNNLQALLGLIALVSKAEVAGEHSALDELHLRIRAMAAAQRYLFGLDNTAVVLISGFLEVLLQEIAPFYTAVRPTFLANGSDLETPSEVAHNLGLAVSESISVISRAVRGPSPIPVVVQVDPGGVSQRIVVAAYTSPGSFVQDPPKLHRRLLQAYARAADCQADLHLDDSPGPRVILSLPLNS
jgi:two-component system, sensor histidine kinase PdtaS